MSFSKTDKTSLRQAFLTKRRALTSLQYKTFNQRIFELLIDIIPWQEITALHSYLPIKASKEIDTNPIIEHIKTNYTYVRIIVPKVDPTTDILTHYRLEEHTKLQNNKWGIPEPVSGDPVASTEIDLVLVPLLVFDLNGNRIGYGKGHYDRFLAGCRPDTQKIGLSYFEPVSNIMIEPTDIPLDMVVTPKKIWEF